MFNPIKLLFRPQGEQPISALIVMSIVMMLLAPWFLLSGSGGLVDQWRFLENSRAVTVTVVEVDSRDSDDIRVYRPVFEIRKANNKKHRFAGDLWEYPPAHEKGAVVTGRYSDESGEIWSNKMLQSKKNFNYVFIASGLGSVLFGCFLLIKIRHRMRLSGQTPNTVCRQAWK